MPTITYRGGAVKIRFNGLTAIHFDGCTEQEFDRACDLAKPLGGRYSATFAKFSFAAGHTVEVLQMARDLWGPPIAAMGYGDAEPVPLADRGIREVTLPPTMSVELASDIRRELAGDERPQTPATDTSAPVLTLSYPCGKADIKLGGTVVMHMDAATSGQRDQARELAVPLGGRYDPADDDWTLPPGRTVDALAVALELWGVPEATQSRAAGDDGPVPRFDREAHEAPLPQAMDPELAEAIRTALMRGHDPMWYVGYLTDLRKEINAEADDVEGVFRRAIQRALRFDTPVAELAERTGLSVPRIYQIRDDRR